ncbi:MAG: hypothetical protein L0H79_10955 [Intrasporangium sp.]|uniref:FAD-dependent oxidoreductase n=1 Tax=Intrasporangium sp. TaxID=1925024 RepID=UPI002647B7BB|nr:hypothetical protein [Intrasporangium sp.]MDN5796253.1 hypothetical protein [Intrasporangium sp.]
MSVVHREALDEMLLGELPPGTVCFDTPAEVESAADGTVALTDGTRPRADLLVAADGIRSGSRVHVRVAVSPPSTGPWRPCGRGRPISFPADKRSPHPEAPVCR